MDAIAIELKEATAFVAKLHRHNIPVIRDKFRVAAAIDGKIVGVVQIARPVSRILDDGKTVEVVRLCTDGTPNACSFLYSRAARAAAELGYKKIITYILETEKGVSLRAAGWAKEADIKGHCWDCPSRPRDTKAPQCNKQRYVKFL